MVSGGEYNKVRSWNKQFFTKIVQLHHIDITLEWHNDGYDKKPHYATYIHHINNNYYHVL